MNHHTTADFWECYGRLPEAVQRVADAKYELLRSVIGRFSGSFCDYQTGSKPAWASQAATSAGERWSHTGNCSPARASPSVSS